MLGTFTYFEIVIGVIALISFFIGIGKGLIGQVFRLLAGIGSIVVAFLISDDIGAFLNTKLTFVADKVGADFALWIWYAASFVLIWLVLGIILRSIGRSLTKAINFVGIKWLNQLLGGVLAVAIIYFIASALIALTTLIPTDGVAAMVNLKGIADTQINGGCYMKLLAENNWFGDWLLTLIK